MSRNGASQITHDLVITGCQKCSVGSIESLNQVEGGLDSDRAGAFDFQVEACVGKMFEGLFERRDPDLLPCIGMVTMHILETTACIELAHFGPSQLGSETLSITGSIDLRVMQKNRDAVARQLDVALENLCAAVDGVFEGDPCVLGAFAGSTAMPHDDRFW